MKKLFTLFFLVGILTLSGCVSTPVKLTKKEIMQDYLSKVTIHDGVTQQEAILIAQSQVIFRGIEKNYHLENPQIVFEKEDSFGIKFYSKYKSLADRDLYPNILVVVQKKDGRTRFYRTQN